MHYKLYKLHVQHIFLQSSSNVRYLTVGGFEHIQAMWQTVDLKDIILFKHAEYKELMIRRLG